MMVTCYLALGANLGNRRKNLKLAVKKINDLKDTKVIKVSRIIETEPLGGPKGQPKYLNAAVKIKTVLSPLLLLKKMQQIERDMGRVRCKRNAARTIDIDILFYADKIIRTKKLTVPHPGMFERDFVLSPLSQII